MVYRRKLFIAPPPPKNNTKPPSSLYIGHLAASFLWYSCVPLETHKSLDVLPFAPERGHCQLFPN